MPTFLKGDTTERMRPMNLFAPMLFALVLVGVLAACGGDPATAVPGGTPTATPSALRGTIEIDGSSTVFPITEAVSEEFRRTNPRVQVNVGVSGTGGGFKRFVAGELDIADASRPIKQSEIDTAKAKDVEIVEMRVATDGLSIVVNPSNDFASCLTVAELKAIWQPASAVRNWNQVRATFPDRPLRLYGPGTDSGTFDYFTEEIVGTARASRADYNASEDDNVLVQGIGGDRNALGYFGFAYYVENPDKVKLVAVDAEKGAGCITPSAQTIEAGTYSPLSRPLFIYVKKASLARPEVRAFVKFYMTNAAALAATVGYIQEKPAVYAGNLTKAGLD